MLTLIRHTLFAGLLALSASLGLAQSINTSLPIIELKTSIYRIQAEVASTQQARQDWTHESHFHAKLTQACCLSSIKKRRIVFG